MSDSIKDLINGMGALAETAGIFRDMLVKNGFTRSEAISMCKTYISTTLSSAAGGNKDGEKL